MDDQVREAVEVTYEGWYAGRPVDWEDFLYRVETYADVDLGTSMVSPEIKEIKAHVRQLRKENSDTR